MPFRFSVASLILVLSAGALIAQDYTGFPENRMRQTRPDNQNVFMPEEVYLENRVVIRTTDILTVGRGMQIRGDILTDFDADSVPPSDTSLPRGQLHNINITVELFYYDKVVERDLTTGKAKLPKIDPKDEGRIVDGQSVTVQPKQSYAGFGLANFELPALSRPLAPGIYKLVARVRLKSQSGDNQRAFKWMSDWYGQRSSYDEETFETIFEPVMGNPTIHEEVYQELLNRYAFVKTENLIWVGEILKNDNLDIVLPGAGTNRKSANIAIWSHHAMIAEQLFDYEYQLDNVDEVIDKDLELKLKVDGATEEMKEKWKKEAEEEKARIRRDNKDLIEKYGGRLSKEELSMLTSTKAARMAVMDQILAFHEYMTYQYWVLVDGLLSYAGWHTVNVPAYNAYEAVQKQDMESGAAARVAALNAAREADGGLQARWDLRREQWKFLPPEATTLAFKYLRTKEELPDWDAKKFVEKRGNKIELNIEEWEKFREDFIVEFYNESEKMLERVTTSRVYANLVWPEAYSAAVDARDDVIRSTFAWEHLIRTDKNLMAETTEAVQEGWKNSPVQNLEGIELSQYYSKGTAAPGTLKMRFETSCNQLKSIVGLKSFTVVYRRALEAENVDRRNLPGKRPPSAPTQE